MFAVVKTGGKQYRVAPNQVIRVEKLDVEPGQSFALTDVLMVSKGHEVTVGEPFVKGAQVNALVLDQVRDKKIIVFKKKRRQNYRRKKGHRQHLTVLKITDIASAKEASKGA